jgi:hypothetical protein
MPSLTQRKDPLEAQGLLAAKANVWITVFTERLSIRFHKLLAKFRVASRTLEATVMPSLLKCNDRGTKDGLLAIPTLFKEELFLAASTIWTTLSLCKATLKIVLLAVVTHETLGMPV